MCRRKPFWHFPKTNQAACIRSMIEFVYRCLIANLSESVDTAPVGVICYPKEVVNALDKINFAYIKESTP